MIHSIKGEILGTFLLVFFGCSAVVTSVTLGAPVGLFQVAIVWGMGLAVAIFLCAGWSGAHFNPAITLALACFGGFSFRRVPVYLGAQFLGAFLAAALVYLLYGAGIKEFEETEGIQRGSIGSEASAMVFGEFYPNPGGAPLQERHRIRVSGGRAFLGEFVGTAILAIVVFSFVTREGSGRSELHAPLVVGATLTVLICVFSPLTMAGFNPARDFAPRVFSSLAGWGGVPFVVNGWGWLLVYIIAPCLGALFGGYFSTRLLWPRVAADRSAASAES